jgi:translation initiation factor eIF-2B subunit epsilon
VKISHAYIFDDTHIDAGTVVEHSIIGSGVKIAEDCTIKRGALVGDGVILGKGAHLRPFERVSRKRGQSEDEESDDEWEEVEQSTY